MLRYLLDTDHLTLYQHGHSLVTGRVALYLGVVGISVVSIEEALRGRLAELSRAGDGPSRIRQYTLLLEALLDFARFRLSPMIKPPRLTSSSSAPFASAHRTSRLPRSPVRTS